MTDLLFKRQRLVNFRIRTCVEKRRIAVVEIETDGFRLAETGRQIDAGIALSCRLFFQFHEKLARQPLSPQIRPRPDALELRSTRSSSFLPPHLPR